MFKYKIGYNKNPLLQEESIACFITFQGEDNLWLIGRLSGYDFHFAG